MINLKNITLLILMMAAVINSTGCKETEAPPDRDEITAVVASHFAFYTPESTVDPDIDRKTTCEECKGTRKVMSGDGISLVACSCGKYCKCQKTGAADERPLVIVYLAENLPEGQRFYCGPCEAVKKEIESGVHTINYEFRDSPEWVRSFPSFHWKADSGKWKAVPAASLDEFLRTYRRHNRQDGDDQTRSSVYSTNGRRWVLNGGSTRGELIEHLLYDSNHRGKFTRSNLEGRTLAELELLHGDDHDNRVDWTQIGGYATPVYRYSSPCANGRCR